MFKAMRKVETITLKGEEIAALTVTDKMVIDRISDGLSLIPNGAENLKEKKKKIFFTDIDDKYVESIVVKSRTLRDMNSFFYQLNLTKYNKSIEECNNNQYESEIEEIDLVYVDFSECLKGKSGKSNRNDNKNADSSDIVKEIFDNGIYVKANGKYRHLVPFDKSASMSRKSIITFIDVTLKDIMDMRLTLGIFSDIEKKQKNSVFPLSKVYAYRGNYLSSGIRVEETLMTAVKDDRFYLDEKSVVVIPDTVSKKREDDIVVYTELNDNDELSYGEKVYKRKSEDFEVNCFDGEGLISPDYANKLGKYLSINRMEEAEDAKSFQIRLPFGKGMLHEVDFKKFFLEELGIKPEKGYIRDYYGINRRIRDIEIVLTASMFKAYKWVEDAWMDKKENDTCLKDPMKIFFERFHKCNHALYVLRTDKSLHNEGMVKLNYQFLNTGNMKNEEFVELIENSLNYSFDLLENKETQCKYLLTGNVLSDENDVDESADNNLDKTYEDGKVEDRKDEREGIIKDLLKYNPRFVRDQKIHNLISGVVASQINGAMLGRLIIRGENRFLSGDLLYLLRELAGRYDCGAIDRRLYNINLKRFKNRLKNQSLVKVYKEKNKGNDGDSNSKTIRMNYNRFYAPVNEKTGIKFIKMKSEESNECKYYAILRNPHLSRNEQCAMIPYEPAGDENLYKKYLGQLSGVLFLAYGTPDAERLSGADFDGDIVKIIDNDIFNKSARECYENNAPVQIPHGQEEKKVIPNSISYDLIKDGFNTRVGMLSDLAIRFGEVEYNENLDINIDQNAKEDKQYKKTKKDKTLTIEELRDLRDGLSGLKKIDSDSPKMDYAAASCIAVGKEIDKAKTGEAPDISLLDAMKNKVESGFIDNKNLISGLKFRSYNKVLDDKGEISRFEYDSDKNYKNRMVFCAPKSTDSNLETLVFNVLNICEKHKKVIDGKKSEKKDIYIPKENSLMGSDEYYSIATKMIAYHKAVNATIAKTGIENKYKGALNYNKIYNIIELQYDRNVDLIEKHTISEALEMTYQMIDVLWDDDYREVERLLDKIIEEKWQFKTEAERNEFIEDIFKQENYQLIYESEKEEDESDSESEDDFDDSISESAEYDYKKEKKESVYSNYPDYISVAKNVLCNFKYKGYLLFYYMVKDVISLGKIQGDIELIKDEIEKKSTDSISGMLTNLIITKYNKTHKEKLDESAKYIVKRFVYKAPDKNGCDKLIGKLNDLKCDENITAEYIKNNILESKKEFDTEKYDTINLITPNMIIDVLNIQKMFCELIEEDFVRYNEFCNNIDEKKRNRDENGNYNHQFTAKKLAEVFRDDIMQLLDNDIMLSLKYWLLLQGKYDKNHNILFDTFSVDEIKLIVKEGDKINVR